MNFCVIGNPIDRSHSPKLFKYIFNKLQMNHYYSSNHINSYNELIKFINTDIIDKNIIGFNITAPYKIKILSFLDKLDASVKYTNSCNCIKIDNNQLIGYNTDIYGFKKLVEHYNINLSNSKIILLGIGGVASSLINFIVKNYSTEIYIYSRNKNKGKQFIDFINIDSSNIKLFQYDNYILDNIQEYTIINCTPLEQQNINEIFDKKISINNCKLYIDINYNFNIIDNTKYITGNVMFVYQALASLDIWFNKKLSNNFDLIELIKVIKNDE